MKFWPKIFFSIYFFPCFLNISVLLITDAAARCSSFYLKAVGQDGFGGESLARIGLIATAVNEGFAYCHSPFYHLHHVGGHEEALENFLNLSGAAHVLFGRDQNCSSIRSKILLGEGLLPRKKFICREGKSIVGICSKTHTCASIFSKKPSSVLKIIPSLRAAFNDGVSYGTENGSDQNVTNIVVHVRRGDAPSHRVLSNKKLLSLIRVLRQRYKNMQIKFHVYSQGNEHEFYDIISEKSVSLHLSAPTVPCRYGSRGMAKNENCLNHTVSEHIVDDLMQTFSSLITADVLVLANSAFSYLAGIYNSGTVYYIYNKKGSFVGNRKPLPSWIALNLR